MSERIYNFSFDGVHLRMNGGDIKHGIWDVNIEPAKASAKHDKQGVAGQLPSRVLIML